MLGVKTKNISSKNLHENRVSFPEERNAFVLDHQHGRRDVTFKPAILVYTAKTLNYGLKGAVSRNVSKFKLWEPLPI